MDNKKLKSSWAAAFTVASVWFGTHVGAGFATGNQVVNYFVQYGWTAAIFPLLAMGILAVVMYIMMKFAKLNGFDNYKDTYRALYPKPWMEIFFEIFYIIIILAAVASCVDGAGGIVKSLIDLPDIICNLVIIALLILLSIFGVDLIIKASTVLSTAILIVTAILVIMGFVVPIDAVAQELATENAAYASIPAIAEGPRGRLARRVRVRCFPVRVRPGHDRCFHRADPQGRQARQHPRLAHERRRARRFRRHAAALVPGPLRHQERWC